MADWGIKVSQPGQDVLTCTPDKLVMSASYNMLKSKIVGLSAGATITVAHGLAYIPVFFTAQLNGTQANIVGDDRNAYADATNFGTGSNTKYYVFYQPGTN